jgi:hypothetical protein
MGYVPTIWRHVKVAFIPKPGGSSYTGPRVFRPISFTLFVLKTMERLVDRCLRDGASALRQQHPNQHTYQAGKSVEMALHQLVVWMEKALDHQEIALGVFLDLVGAFSYTSFESCQAWGQLHYCPVD